jgi:hypothetical protein
VNPLTRKLSWVPALLSEISIAAMETTISTGLPIPMFMYRVFPITMSSKTRYSPHIQLSASPSRSGAINSVFGQRVLNTRAHCSTEIRPSPTTSRSVSSRVFSQLTS